MKNRWPVWLIYSVFSLKAMNSIIVKLDWWEKEACWHFIANQWCYERAWYFTFSYRRWEMIVPAILLVYEKKTKTKGLNVWVYVVLLTFYCYELIEYWAIYNKIDKLEVSLVIAGICMGITIWKRKNE